jgi:predicted metal-dependent phosphoesterase TrpH
MSEKKCDLHIHTTYSDSDATVEEVFSQAREVGLCCVGIADHDTVAALEQASTFVKKYDVELLGGIEISAQEANFEVHVLGYGIDPYHHALNDALKNVKQQRLERLIFMIEKLQGVGLEIDKQQLLAQVEDTMATRLHLGMYLVERGFVRTLGDAFKKYLAPGRPGYAARFKYSVKEAILLIKSAGGLAFLAHPHMIPDQSSVEKFISYGIDGLEVKYPGMPALKQRLYSNMVKKHGLLRCGGSDAHGSYKAFTRIGGVTVPYSWVQEIKDSLSSDINSKRS